MNPGQPDPASRGWRSKFAVAFAGLLWSIRTQASFRVHGLAAVGVLGLAAALRLEPWRWSVLLLAIGMVWSAELINTAIEQLAKTLHPTHDERIGLALDAAAAGVLVAAIGSVPVGLLALGPPLWDFARRWMADG